MTSEEFEEFTQRIEKMRNILSWVKTYDNIGKKYDYNFADAIDGGLECENCPLDRYKPKWANLPKGTDLCRYGGSQCTNKYKKVISIWDKENAKYALEEALDDV